MSNKKSNEINVRAFVDVKDVIGEIPKEDFVEEIKNRYDSGEISQDDLPDHWFSSEEPEQNEIGDFGDDEILSEVKDRSWNEAEAEEMIFSLLEEHPNILMKTRKSRANFFFKSPADERLFDDFKESLESQNRNKLISIFERLNRPEIHKTPITI